MATDEHNICRNTQLNEVTETSRRRRRFFLNGIFLFLIHIHINIYVDLIAALFGSRKI